MANNNWEIKAAGFVSGLQPVVEQWAARKRESKEVGDFTSKVRGFYDKIKANASGDNADPWAIQTLQWFESDPGMMSMVGDDIGTYRQLQAALSLPKAPQPTQPDYEYKYTKEYNPDNPNQFRNVLQIMANGQVISSFPVSEAYGESGSGHFNINLGGGKLTGNPSEVMSVWKDFRKEAWRAQVGDKAAEKIGLEEARDAYETYKQWEFLTNLQNPSEKQKEYIKSLRKKMETYFGKKFFLGADWAAGDDPKLGRMSDIGGPQMLVDIFERTGTGSLAATLDAGVEDLLNQFQEYYGFIMNNPWKHRVGLYQPEKMWETSKEQTGE